MGGANLMRHCRQCRADAVGLLGEDRSDEFTLDRIEQMEVVYDLAKRRATLEAEHERLSQQVRRGYIRVRRDTLALGAGLAFATGALATVCLPWLQAATGLDAAAHPGPRLHGGPQHRTPRARLSGPGSRCGGIR